jgi:hypothetical protein
MYHYYACALYLTVKMYQYSSVLDTTVRVCKDIGSFYGWLAWAIAPLVTGGKPKDTLEDSHLDWVLILEDDDSSLIS